MKIYVTVLILLFTTLSFADELKVPFSVYPKEIQQSFKDNNIKLDLDPNDRTKDSWGFLKNEGQSYTIYTYQPINPEELNLVMKIIMEQK